jgi:N-acetylmuramoyl-L-alanine amidase
MTAGRFARAFFLAALASGPALAEPEYARLRAVRPWSLAEVTGVVVETSGETEYRAERVGSPDRIFFDLLGTRPQPGKRGLEIVPVNDPLLRQIRIAETRPGVVRIVLDLAAAAEYTVARLKNPDRLVIELRAAAVAPTLPPALPEPPKVEPQKTVAPLPAAAPPPPALAARRDSRGEQSLIRALGLKLQRVILDAGHGGHDTGTIAPNGLTEKELVLDVAKRLGAFIEQRLGSEVLYTRSDDVFVPLEERTALATEKRADLFLSIHANSSQTPSIAGPETYYLNFTTDAHALDVAARENATSARSIKDYPGLLEKIALNEKVRESREFAEAMQRALYAGLMRGRGVRNRGVKKAPFVVLIGADIPSVLAEIAFMSNPRDAQALRRPDYRQRIAEALFKGVSQYTDTLSHYRVAQKKDSSPVTIPASAPAER